MHVDDGGVCDSCSEYRALIHSQILRTKKPYDSLKSELQISSAAHEQIPPYALLDLDNFEQAFQSCFEYDTSKRPVMDDLVKGLECVRSTYRVRTNTNAM